MRAGEINPHARRPLPDPHGPGFWNRRRPHPAPTPPSRAWHPGQGPVALSLPPPRVASSRSAPSVCPDAAHALGAAPAPTAAPKEGPPLVTRPGSSGGPPGGHRGSETRRWAEMSGKDSLRNILECSPSPCRHWGEATSGHGSRGLRSSRRVTDKGPVGERPQFPSPVAGAPTPRHTGLPDVRGEEESGPARRPGPARGCGPRIHTRPAVSPPSPPPQIALPQPAEWHVTGGKRNVP